ncbi:sigma-70 family RNA polymerase sigma factor [Acidobacteria bacterium AB60]|nr:sigma-70 family RNA polymerase sigma factor [Acidobacteria bacterium AB60]
MEDIEHLFRRESGRLVSILSRIFGMRDLALAEDVVQEAFCRALEVWSFRGVPENPSAWLMATAKNKAFDILRRRQTALSFESELAYKIDTESSLAPTIEQFFEPKAIQDDVLRMMFSCCDPGLKEEAQVALILHILCGFSVSEISEAFVSPHSTIEKRITRSKKVLAACEKLFNITSPQETSLRLRAVHRALYLLFNEGYHGSSQEAAIRADLCREAMRLTSILLTHPQGRTPTTYALAALMSLNSARLPGRVDGSGNLQSISKQDRTKWDRTLISDGMSLLEQSAAGTALSEYHIEAAIASIHVRATDTDQTDWKTIVTLYDRLLALRRSPIVGLNRAIAVAQLEGPERGIRELESIVDRDRLVGYPFYFAALAECELLRGCLGAARDRFRAAASLARNPMERSFFEQRLSECGIEDDAI